MKWNGDCLRAPFAEIGTRELNSIWSGADREARASQSLIHGELEMDASMAFGPQRLQSNLGHPAARVFSILPCLHGENRIVQYAGAVGE
jgi:hypothetical protein